MKKKSIWKTIAKIGILALVFLSKKQVVKGFVGDNAKDIDPAIADKVIDEL